MKVSPFVVAILPLEVDGDVANDEGCCLNRNNTKVAFKTIFTRAW